MEIYLKLKTKNIYIINEKYMIMYSSYKRDKGNNVN